jgi:thiol-disulfide isomerase/thioredoxin
MDRNVRAPELNLGLGWLNTDRPLGLHDTLRGQVVVLDFWTYCCINCMHILPDLARLEKKFHREPVAFIGVHSAKFSNEASRETIRAAILRYEIKHPVVIDDKMKIWRAYAVRSWPTLVVIDSRGYVVGTAAGESGPSQIEPIIEQALAGGRADGSLASAPLEYRLEGSVRAASGLNFPGKVLADAASSHLFIADSNHNRIVVAELPDEWGHSKVIKVVGSGEIGSQDGPADRASFNHPQGIACGHGNLYVADTENHLLRAIDLETYQVRTIVGTGKMTYDFSGGAMGPDQGINSPWDLTLEGSTLYVAMAGTHQIWRIDMPVGFSRSLAGTGRENLVDGPTETSAFAQPSGICALGGKLYIADSEVSAIRGIDMATEQVFTVLGEGLFSFGDVDGVAPKAKLQHPLGIAAWNSALLVADTYNHKIKLVEPGARSARTLYGAGRSPLREEASSEGAFPPLPLGEGRGEGLGGKLEFFEPGGLSVAADRLFVADTNNHRIIAVDLRTHRWCEVILEGLRSPCSTESAEQMLVAGPFEIAPGRDIELVLDVALPPAMHLNPEAPWSVRVTENGATLAQRTGRSGSLPIRITVPAAPAPPKAEWNVEAAFASCSDAGGLCVPHHLRWRAAIMPGTGAVLHLPGWNRRPRNVRSGIS